MKLLIYSHFFSPSVGGVETVILSLARGLAKLHENSDQPQFEITVVSETPRGDFPDSNFPFRVIRRPGLLELQSLIRKSDVVHLAGPALAPLLLSYILRKPVVVEHHGFQTICPNGGLFFEPLSAPCPGHFMPGRHALCLHCNAGQGRLASMKLWLLTFLRRFLCKRVAANIAPTRWLGEQISLPRVTSIPHGVEAKIQRREAQCSPRRPTIAFIGRLVSTKGVRELFIAAKILKEQNRVFELLIIGDGPERASLEEFARRTQISSMVRFAGRLEEEELETVLGRALALVVPSLAGEVFGMVIAENMLRGKAIVASDLGAFSEVLDDAGLKFRTGDAFDLAMHISKLIEAPQSARELGDRAYRRAQQLFDFKLMLRAHAETYIQVAATPKR
jgi:glycosyltransferase involved in cell wall biosynthesis